MKTPIEQLIDKLEDLRDLIGDDDTMYRGGVVNAIRLAEGMLEKEKEFIDMKQQSEEDWVEDMLR